MRIFTTAFLAVTLVAGANAQSVTGSASLILDKEVKTCNGVDVYAVPKTKKSSKRVKEIYGEQLPTVAHINLTPNIISMRIKDKSMDSHRMPGASDALGKYLKGTKKAKCKGGSFEFSKLKAGEWYIVAPVFYPSNTRSARMTPGSTSQGLSGRSADYSGITFIAEVAVEEGKTLQLPFEIDGRTPPE